MMDGLEAATDKLAQLAAIAPSPAPLSNHCLTARLPRPRGV